ncbi:MAG: hypothetical protein LBG61_03660 [Burkholderiales bacterium]|jgi:hypothetical protein|nr:hypothetical protein [Burkholderiales bacterium]
MNNTLGLNIETKTASVNCRRLFEIHLKESLGESVFRAKDAFFTLPPHLASAQAQATIKFCDAHPIRCCIKSGVMNKLIKEGNVYGKA